VCFCICLANSDQVSLRACGLLSFSLLNTVNATVWSARVGDGFSGVGAGAGAAGVVAGTAVVAGSGETVSSLNELK